MKHNKRSSPNVQIARKREKPSHNQTQDQSRTAKQNAKAREHQQKILWPPSHSMTQRKKTKRAAERERQREKSERETNKGTKISNKTKRRTRQ